MGSYKYLLFSLGLLNSFMGKTDSACTLPSYMTGTWYDSRYIEVEFMGGTIMYLNQYAITRTGSDTNFTCELSSGNTYILRTVQSITATISGVNGQYYYYLCMEVTQVTSYSFYYYPQEAADSNGERIVAKLTSESITSTSDICSATPIGKELFHTMVHKDFASSAVTQFPDPFLGNFAFTLSDTLSTSSTGNITGCDNVKTANVTYSTTQSIKVGLAADKYYGCVASFVSGSTYYSSWYNFDTTINTGFNLRFVCVVAAYDGTDVTATQRGRVCKSGQTTTAMPSTDSEHPYGSNSVGGIIYLIPFRTCVPTDDVASSSSSSNAGVIAAAVIIIILLIVAAVVGFLIYKCYYLPKKEEKRKRLEAEKKPKSHIGMMKKAVDAGFGGNIHKEKAKSDILDMVEMEDDEGVEGSVTGMHPNAFKEHNNNMKLNAKFIGTTTPLTPSAISTDFEDPNAVPENSLSRQKSKITSGFSANTQGTTSTDTPTSTAEQNGHTPRSSAAQNGSTPRPNGITPRTDAKLNENIPSVAKPVSEVQPSVMTSAVVHNDINRIQREKSIVPNSGNKPVIVPNSGNKPAETNRSVDGKSADPKSTVATVSPFVEEKPKIIQDNPKSDDTKREEKLRKSVSFAGDKPAPNTNTSSVNANNPTSNITKPDKADLPGVVQEQQEPEITLPREPSNLMGPRDTTLPEIDLKNF